MASELAVKAATLVDVKNRLEAEVASKSKRIGFQRAIDVVTSMHLELLNEVLARENETDSDKVRKVSA
jgi:hypothetical protein